MKKVFVLLLSIMLLLAISVPALASSDYLSLQLETVKYETYGPLDSLKMTGSSKTKELYLGEGTIAYLIQENKTLKINMEYLTVTIPASAWNCSEYQQAVKTGEPVSATLTIDIWALYDEYQYFNASVYNAKGMYKADKSNFSVDLDFVGGTSHFTAKHFATPITINASFEWTPNVGGLYADSVAFYWMDKDSALETGNYDWQYVPGTTNGKASTVTFSTDLAYGYFMAVAAKEHKDSADTNSATVNDGGSISGHWAEADIVFMQQKYIVREAANAFYPNRDITRAEFACYLVRTLGLDTNTALAGKFADVAQSHACYNEIYTAAQAGLVNGTSDSTFAPDAKIKRQEMAAMISRALQKSGKTVNSDAAVLVGYTDKGQIASWAKDSASIVVNGGLFSGRSDNTFAPLAYTTRAEAVVILHRLYNQL